MKGTEAIKGFKEKFGKPGKELMEWIKYCNKSMAAVRKSLAGGEKTVPAIAKETGLPSAEVFWLINAMKKYGEAAIAGEDGDYRLYSLKGDNDEKN